VVVADQALGGPAPDRAQLQQFIHLKLLALGLPGVATQAESGLSHLVTGLLSNYRQKSRLLSDYRSPVDKRIEGFLNGHTAHLNLPEPLRLPGQTFGLDRPGVARELSLPMDSDTYESELLSSYRVRNGVLHNPRSDRRTTAGTFHVAEGGLPVPGDKVAVPLAVFAKLFQHAVKPPRAMMELPYTAHQPQKAEGFCTLLLRPIVVPEIPGKQPAKRMEVRFYVPGSLVSNLDFVESIFGNAGDPVLPENDAALDPQTWTGHTGCVILAPHLTQLTKKELGLPHVDQATARQKRDGACWKDADEKYNNGTAFKITCRTEQGVIVTLIADNYYGYCKKEVKTQISYAANLYGSAEEEHAGGALAFLSFSLGDAYRPNPRYGNGRTFADVARDYGHIMDVKPEGYGVDKRYPNVIYIAEDAVLDSRSLTVEWTKDGKPQTLPLLAEHVYMPPWGQKLTLNKHPGSGRFRVIITVAEGVFCHKPCTVSGGGKSEISKSLSDYMIYGPIYVGNLQKDLDAVEVILAKDHSKRWKPGKAPQDYAKTPSRPILSKERTLGSVIKLLTPSDEYTDEYNKWLASIPTDILAFVFLIKRLFKPEWGDNWRSHFTVDVVNGEDGHELKVDDKKAGGTYLRVGLLPNHGWRTYKLRQDFFPAAKVQTEDDITASVVVPPGMLPAGVPTTDDHSLKLLINCETRLFQRPDDAIIPGFDKQTEIDLSKPNNFISNFQPLSSDEAKQIVDKITEFDAYTSPMKRLLADAAAADGGLVVSSAHPRIVDGKPTKNPRYLQDRPDLVNPLGAYLADIGTRFWRAMPADQPLARPVDAVLVGRRNNPPDKEAGIRPLAVYNPIHYQDLPELFMDFVCSLTGKSPSTTGAGSEGALTKAPFNAVAPVIDLNAALVSYILTGLGGFSTAAGYVGPNIRVDHDISLLVPEIWCRLKPHERDAKYMIDNGYLEPITDFQHGGQTIPASRLGYRITYQFVRTFFGRLFDSPGKVFDEAMLKPETQDMEAYVDGILNIVEAQHRVAKQYFEDGSVEQAIPPLKAVLHIMVHGHYEGKDAHHPDVRRLFTREHLMQSDWYRARLTAKQASDVALWKRHVEYLQAFTANGMHAEETQRLDIAGRLTQAKADLARVSESAYVQRLVGTLGVDPTVAGR
jgi:hypothetical protein